jgi:WD40 repeat protein
MPRLARFVLIPVLVTAFAASVAVAAVPEEPMLAIDAGGHTALVRKVLFTPDGKGLISVSHDKAIRIWDVQSGEPTRVLRPPIDQGRRRDPGPLPGTQVPTRAGNFPERL